MQYFSVSDVIDSVRDTINSLSDIINRFITSPTAMQRQAGPGVGGVGTIPIPDSVSDILIN